MSRRRTAAAPASGLRRTPLATRVFGAVTVAAAPLAQSRAGRKVQNALTRGHAALLTRFGLAGRIGSAPILLLTTTGRRSGQARTTPLMYVPGTDPVLIASNGGSARHPSWYLNLLDRPEALVEIAGERMEVVARTVNGSERERLWDEAVAVYPAYARYQRSTGRELPVIVLDTDREGAREQVSTSTLAFCKYGAHEFLRDDSRN